MQSSLRPYQERIVQELLDNPNRYLAVSMGLGKTASVLEFIKRSGKDALVIAPLLVAQRTWPEEIERWVKEISYGVIHGKSKQEVFNSNAQIKIINYDGLSWLYKAVKENPDAVRGRVLILDESTCIKSPGSQRFKALKAMLGLFSGHVCMSGTPISKSYVDLWSQYYCLDRGIALEKSVSAYKAKYFYVSGPPRWICELKPSMDRIIQRQVKPLTTVMEAEDYLQLPEALYLEKTVSLSPEARQKYDGFRKEYLENTDVTSFSEGVLLNKLRQISQGALYDENHTWQIYHTAKIEALQSLVEEAAGSPILCPISFKFELAMIRDAFGYEVPSIVGGIGDAERSRILDKWNAGKTPLLLCHPASLSHGLNLQHGGSIICWLGLPWSMELYKQLNGRLIRPGQNDTVKIYHLLAEKTVDKQVMDVLKRKEATEQDFKQAVKESLLEYEWRRG